MKKHVLRAFCTGVNVDRYDRLKWTIQKANRLKNVSFSLPSAEAELLLLTENSSLSQLWALAEAQRQEGTETFRSRSAAVNTRTHPH